jgi:glycosyltransferase involved in cell wall biosynthesis
MARGASASCLMKVLFLASYFPKPDNPIMGTWALAQAQALVKQGVDVQVVSFTSWLPTILATTPGAKAYAHCPRTHIWPGAVAVQYPRWLYYPVPPLKQRAYVHPQPYLHIAALSAQTALKKLIDQFQPDVFFCHHTLPNGWLIRQLPTAYQRPFVIQEHDFDEISDCQIYPKRRAAMEYVVQQAHSVLAVSQRMARDLKGLFPHTTVHTNPIGVSLLPLTSPQPRPIELRDRQVILSCALFAERKGLCVLIEAFQRIARKHPQAILRIVGGGIDEDKMKQMITDFNLTQQVQMVGKKTHPEVLQEMQWADCFALVSWDEPWGLVYLEAMASEKPILCCNDGGINDVIENGQHGFTVPPRDVVATAVALDQLLSHNSHRLDMGRQARQLVERELSWDRQASHLKDCFEQAIAHGPVRI